MQAIVLVGGEGTRLRPLTYRTPKPMVPIMNVPFLARTMERLYVAGIRDVILAAGYMPQAIVDYFGDGSGLGMKLTYAIEETPLGTAGALKNVEQHITGPFFVLNGDIFTSLDLTAMRRFHEKRGGLGVLHLIRVDDPSAFGCVPHDGDGRIEAFVEKPHKDEAPTNEINAGTYLLEREILDLISPGRNVSIERETFPQAIAAGKALYAYTTGDYWIDLGRPEQYLAAHRDVLSGAMPLLVEPGISGDGKAALQGHPGVVPPVHADGDVVVDASATIGPNVVLGQGCSVGAGAAVRESVLWDRVSVGSGAVIEEAILASRVIVGPKARVGRGSVIGHDVTIEPGATIDPGSRVPASG
ncbi:MAG TPA: NDP-sugar synthase [Candidatus Cybelea sp.]|nr:NDP-sugar synthase [Candidatus Cybelea sp.]